MKKRILSLLFCLLFVCASTGGAMAYQSSAAVSYQKKQVDAGGTTISANVLIVNLADPDIKASVVLADGKLNNTKSFSAMVEQYDPVAMVNGNFFNSYDTVKDPVGSIMSNGQFVYASSGLAAMGITNENKVIFGRPLIFTKISTCDTGQAKSWTAYEVNTLSQGGEQSVLYTPARGSSVTFTEHGTVMKVENDRIASYQEVNPSSTLAIPANGYLVFFSPLVNATHYFATPEVGRQVEISYTHFKEDAEGFDLANVQQVLSGAPRLLKGGAIDNTPLEAGFSGDARFESNSAPRTAVGKLADGRLIIVNATATIPQLKQMMLNLGAVDAINIDGGASTAMYANGQYITTPGRQLTSFLMIQKNTDGPPAPSKYDNIAIYVGGKKLVMDQKPIMDTKNDRVLAPLRFIGEALGYEVSWDDASQTAGLDREGTSIRLQIGSKVAYKNGEAITLDVAALEKNDRTYVPVRFIAEALEAEVSWDDNEPAVHIQTN